MANTKFTLDICTRESATRKCVCRHFGVGKSEILNSMLIVPNRRSRIWAQHFVRIWIELNKYKQEINPQCKILVEDGNSKWVNEEFNETWLFVAIQNLAESYRSESNNSKRYKPSCVFLTHIHCDRGEGPHICRFWGFEVLKFWIFNFEEGFEVLKFRMFSFYMLKVLTCWSFRT